jgi:hypothetical protein
MIFENIDVNLRKNLFWKYISSGDIKNINDFKEILQNTCNSPASRQKQVPQK